MAPDMESRLGTDEFTAPLGAGGMIVPGVPSGGKHR